MLKASTAGTLQLPLLYRAEGEYSWDVAASPAGQLSGTWTAAIGGELDGSAGNFREHSSPRSTAIPRDDLVPQLIMPHDGVADYSSLELQDDPALDSVFSDAVSDLDAFESELEKILGELLK